MKIHTTTQLRTLRGIPMKDHQDKPLTIGSVCVEALLGNYADEQNLPGKDKAARWRLATVIDKASGEVSLTADEVVLLKGLVAKAYTPLVVGQAWELLEGNPLDETSPIRSGDADIP